MVRPTHCVMANVMHCVAQCGVVSVGRHESAGVVREISISVHSCKSERYPYMKNIFKNMFAKKTFPISMRINDYLGIFRAYL